MTPSRPEQDRLAGESAASERIDKSWYDESEYIQSATYLHDFASSFQRYRLRKVLAIDAISFEDRVLDLGCGWGTMTYGIAQQAREVVGLDFSQRAVAHCNALLARTRARNVEFRVGDACDTGLPARSFDVAVAADLFEHLYPDDSEAVAAEAFRVLKPAGRFLVWTPSSSHFLEVLRNNDVILKRDPSHVDYKSMVRMTALLRNAGFRIDRAYFTESHLPGLRLLERMGQRFIPLLRRRIAVLGRKPTLSCAPSEGGGERERRASRGAFAGLAS